jgi:hypothetical protein
MQKRFHFELLVRIIIKSIGMCREVRIYDRPAYGRYGGSLSGTILIVSAETCCAAGMISQTFEYPHPECFLTKIGVPSRPDFKTTLKPELRPKSSRLRPACKRPPLTLHTDVILPYLSLASWWSRLPWSSHLGFDANLRSLRLVKGARPR